VQSYNGEILWQRKLERHQLTVGTQYKLIENTEVLTRGNIHLTRLHRTPEGFKFVGRDEKFLRGEGEQERLWAGLLQDIIDLNDTHQLILGGRYDSYSRSGSTFSPRVAIISNFFEKYALKFSYSEAFFAPLNVSRHINIFPYIGDPNIKAQTIQTVDFVFQNRQEAETKFNYAVTLFRSVIDDVLKVNLNRRPSFINGEKANYYGTELESRFQINPQIFIWGNYTYTASEDEELDSDYENSIKHLGNVGFSFEPWNYFYISSWAHIFGEQSRLSTLPGGESSLDPGSTVQLSFLYKGFSNTDLRFTVENLFDEENFYPNIIAPFVPIQRAADYPAEGRQILFTVSKTF
jgi:outer membrane receptor protein involved in Fe transport